MQFHYIDYSYEKKSATRGWPGTNVIETEVELPGGQQTLEFFNRLEKVLVERGGYFVQHNAAYEDLGVLPGCSALRIFRADTGEQLVLLFRRDGEDLSAREIADAATRNMFMTIRNPRSIRPIAAREGDAMHIVVNADFRYHLPEYDPGKRDLPTYEAKVL